MAAHVYLDMDDTTASAGQSPVDRWCSLVVTRLGEDAERLAASVWSPLAAELPAWAVLAEGGRAEGLRSGVRWAVEACLGALERDGGRPTPAECDTMRALGADQADLGVPLPQLAEALRRAVSDGYAVVVDEVRAIATPLPVDGIDGLDVLGGLSHRLMGFTNALSEAMTEGW